MANTFTSVVDTIFAMGLQALRENAVMARLVNTDWSNEVAQQGDTINVKVPSAMTVGNVAPAAVPIAGQDVTPTVVPVTLDRWRQTEMHLTDKEAMEIAGGATGSGPGLQLSEAMKVLGNDVDTYILGLYYEFYGFYGTPGTTPFGSNLDDATHVRRLLQTQLAPTDPRYLVIDPDAGAEVLQNEAAANASWKRGGADSLVTGEIGDLFGMTWIENQNVTAASAHTNGTLTDGSGHKALFDGGGSPATVGDKTADFDETSLSGTVTKGSVFTVAGDDQTYVVTALATAATNAITLAFEPGIQVAWADDAQMTLKGAASATYVNNMAFHRDALALAVRPLAPADGFTGGNEFRTDVDPITGLGLTLEVSRQHFRTAWTWSILYGADVLRRECGVRLAG